MAGRTRWLVECVDDSRSDNWFSAQPAIVNLDLAPSAPPISELPESVVARPGQIGTLSAVVRGTYPLTIEWLKEGTTVQGPNDLNRYVEGAVAYGFNTTAADAGTYTLRASNSFGTTVQSVRVEVGPASQLSNLSVRARVGTGDQVMIVGFVLAAPKQVLMQALGSELTGYGVSGVLPDPTATLFASDGTQTTNDDGGMPMPWQDPLYDLLGAQKLALGLTKSSEIRAELSAGANTIVVGGVGGTTGVALAQIFDADGTTNRMINLSARVYAGAGDDTAITGFIIKGDRPEKVLVRCVGPGLRDAGVTGYLADPSFHLVDQATGATLAANDDWDTGDDAAELSRVMRLVGAFPLAAGSKDAAAVVTLPPGAYTALASGAGSTTGIVLLEVYEVP